MALSPLAPVRDYQSMLNRIYWFTTAAALAAVWLLRKHVQVIDDSLSRLDFAVSLEGGATWPAPAGYLLPALAIGMATRVFRLHALLSDCLGIRECFDVDVILHGMAERLGVDLHDVDEARLRAARHGVMRRAFYPYVSGPRPQIDGQLVEQALDAWSWFWVGVEAATVFTVTAFALIAGGARETGFQTLAAALVLAAVVLPAIRRQCARYALAQVRAILEDPARAAAVRGVLEELAAAAPSSRRAA